MKLKHRRKKYKKLRIIVWTIIISLISSFVLIQTISKKINPILLRYASVETKRFATMIINQSIDNEVLEKIDQGIFTVSKNEKSEIQTVDFDSKKVNILLKLITNKIQNQLKNLENGNIKELNIADTFKGVNYKNLKKGVVCEIPAGVIFSNSLLSNIGPVIPVKLNFIGQVITNITTDIKEYGINNAYVEVGVHIEVTEKITMPIATKQEVVKVDFPLEIKIIQGKIPSYYGGSTSKSSNIFSLPLDQ